MLAFDRRLSLAVLVALTLIAGWLRFSGIDFGLPDRVRPDEEFLVPFALDFNESWNPHWSVCPPAQTYLVHGVLRSYAMLTGAAGADLHDVYGSDHDRKAFAITRRVTATMGTATVPIIYFAAVPVFGQVAALTASAIVAVSFIHIRESKFAKDEVPAGLWLALSIMMMLRIAMRGQRLDYILAGAFCGLAAATHYPAGAISIGILAAHLEGRQREGQSVRGFLMDSRIYLAGLVSILAFLCADPYFVLDWPQTVKSFTYIRNSYLEWNPANTPAGSGWPWLLLRAMPAGFGIELEVLMLAGVARALWRPRPPGTWALLTFIAECFLSLTSGHPQIVFRYLVNPLLAMALLGGLFASDALAAIRCWLGSWFASLVGVLAGLALVLPSTIRAIEFDRLLTQPDTRTIAREWMFKHVPPQTSLVIMLGGNSFGKPQIVENYLTYPLENLSMLPATPARVARWVVADALPPLGYWSKGISEDDLAQLRSKGKLEFDLNPLRPGAAAPVFDPNDAFFAPFDHITSMNEPGPRLWIWKLSDTSKEASK